MSNEIGKFLIELQKKSVNLLMDGENLRVIGSANQLSNDMLKFIKQHKIEIIQQLIKNDVGFELSYGQISLWTIYQLSPNSSAYHVSCVLKTNPQFDQTIFKRALELISNRHEILRTVYYIFESQPLQKILPQLEIPIIQTVKSHCTSEEIEHFMTVELAQPFDLEVGPVARVHYLKNERENTEADHFLLFVFHHIAIDMISLNIVINEVAKAYEALLHQFPLELPRIQYSYVQFFKEQKNRLNGPEGQKILNFWKDQFKEAPSPLMIPIDKSRPSIQTFNGDHFVSQLNPEVKQQLLQKCKQLKVTPYVYFLTVYYIFLYRYCAQNDIIVGTPTAGRDSHEAENLVGYFINVLPLKIRINGECPFAEFVQLVHANTILALDNSHIPFSYLVQHIQPQRDQAFAAVFNVMFNWNQSRKLANEQHASSSLIATQKLGGASGASHDVVLNIVEGIEHYEIVWTYNTDLFFKKTLQRMHGHFETILMATLNDVNQSIDGINCLTTNELQQINLEWNPQVIQYEKAERCLHQFFEEMAETMPEQIALSYQDQTLSYHQLNQRSNQLAHYLMTHGVKKEILVFVSLLRSIEQIIAILAICKAGGAYVPVDPSLPKERVVELIHSANPALIISEKQWSSLFTEHKDRYIDFHSIKPNPRIFWTNPTSVVGPENLAYVIFTSGSTGIPKGVSIEHRSAVNTIISINNMLNLTADDCVLGLSAINFDLSVYDIFGTFAVGAKLVILPEEYRKDPSYWFEQCQQQQVTLWNSVPALMQMMMQYLENKQYKLTRLRAVMMSGDWVPLQLPAKILSLVTHRPCQIYSLGGATEASIWSICYPIETVDEHWKSIPYGKALPNQSFHVFNKQLQYCPVGVIGELYIGGIGLAREYLNDPVKTSASFVYHPRLKQRLYRTGDLGRYFNNGDIEFIGRQDNQVKLNGFRIELGEIEALLTKHPKVRRVIVIIREESATQKYIAAYIESDAQGLKEELQQLCAKYLPLYMIPSQFITVSGLPLTSTGKVNIQALPKPEISASIATNDIELTPTEQRLKSIWKTVLNHENIDRDASFFMHGGNSLLVIQLHHEIQHQFAVNIPIAQIFAHPYLKSLADYLDGSKPDNILEMSKQRFNRRRKPEKIYEPTNE